MDSLSSPANSNTARADARPFFSGVRMLAKIGRFTRPHRLLLTLGLICSVALPLINVGFAWLMQFFIDTIAHGNMHTLNVWIAVVSVIIVVLITVALFGQFLREYVRVLTARDVAASVLGRLLSLPLLKAQRAHSGDLVSRVTGDAPTVAALFATNVFQLASGVLTTVIAFAYLVHINLLFACVATAVGPVTFWTGRFFDRRLRLISKDVQDKAADIRSTLQEWLQGMMVVRAFG